VNWLRHVTVRLVDLDANSGLISGFSTKNDKDAAKQALFWWVLEAADEKLMKRGNSHSRGWRPGREHH
jgi:hypothetical protein